MLNADDITFEPLTGEPIIEWLWTGCALYRNVNGEWVFVPKEEWPRASCDRCED